MKKLTIALLSGGDSPEREVSLNSGSQVFDALDKDRYRIVRYDPRDDLPRLMADAATIDAALIILHGPNGEDGTIQGLLDLLGIPYQGSGVLGSALAMNKLAAKGIYERCGIPVPPYAVVRKGRGEDWQPRVEALGMPLVVKPAVGGSSIGMSIVRSAGELQTALETAFSHDDTVLVEAFLQGTELTGGVLGNEELEALPLIEIIPEGGHDFFDYAAKYTAGETREICPARVDDEVTGRARRLALDAHRALFCRGYSRTDMILVDRDLFVLETNTIPGMTATSLFPQAAGAAGIRFGALLDRLIDLSLEGADGRKPPASVRSPGADRATDGKPATTTQVGIVMGSDSDLPVMEAAAAALKSFGITFEMTVASAHRSPERAARFAAEARQRGFKAIIAGAGHAAHLAGVLAAHTTLPVIGVPIDSSCLQGLDALLSTVQMPPGVPVATMAVGKPGARNAAILAAQIIGVADVHMAGRLEAAKQEMARQVEAKAARLADLA